MGIIKSISTILVGILLAFSVSVNSFANEETPKVEKTFSLTINADAQKALITRDSMGVAMYLLDQITYDTAYKDSGNILRPNEDVLMFWESYYEYNSSKDLRLYINLLNLRIKVLDLYKEHYESKRFQSFFNSKFSKNKKSYVKRYRKDNAKSIMAFHNSLRKRGELILEDRVYTGTEEDFKSVYEFIKTATFDKEFAENLVLDIGVKFDRMSSVGKMSKSDSSLNTEKILKKDTKYFIERFGRDEVAFASSALALSLEDLYQQLLDPSSIYFKASQKRAEMYKQRISFFENKKVFDR